MLVLDAPYHLAVYARDSLNAPADPGLPLFYKNPRALKVTAHAGCGVEPTVDFAFAAATNSIPIGTEEFFEALAFYPIVFAATEPIIPVAVLGLAVGRNVFVGAAGLKRPGT